MRRLYVVTHPEATHHVDGLVGGWYDSDLTARGLEQAGQISDALVGLLADSARLGRGPGDRSVEVFSSDLRRAHRTAEVVAKRLDVDVEVDRRLREKSYGEAGGRPQAWLTERFIPPPVMGERMRHHEGVDGAETKWEWASRAYEALDRILESEVADQVVVTHGGTATYLIAAWIRMPLESAGYVTFGLSSGGITVLREDDFFHNRHVATLNQVDHLS